MRHDEEERCVQLSEHMAGKYVFEKSRLGVQSSAHARYSQKSYFGWLRTGKWRVVHCAQELRHNIVTYYLKEFHFVLEFDHFE